MITTTRKKLDREREDRHTVQVNPDLCPLTYSQLVVHLYGEMFPSVLQVFCHLNSIPGRISKHCTTLGQSSTKLWRNIKKTEFLRLNGSFYIFIIIWRKQTSKYVVIIKEGNRAWDKLFTLKKHFSKSFMLLKYKMIFFY